MKSIIITGATSGIGYECAIQLAKTASQHQLIIPARNEKLGNEVVQTIKHKTNHNNIICLPLDLASLASIREFSHQFNQGRYGRIISLVNNAGLQIVGETRYTKDGFEETFGVNHLGPFYLTLLLMPYLTEDASITFTASGTHDPGKKTGMPAPHFRTPQLLAYPEDIADQNVSVGQRRYTTSKLCNILTVYELQKRLAGTNIRVNAFDPGLVPGTGLARSYPPVMQFIAGAIFNVLRLFHPNVNTARNSGMRLANLAWSEQYKNYRGRYFEGEKQIQSSADAYNTAFQKELWQSSVEFSGIRQQETTISLA